MTVNVVLVHLYACSSEMALHHIWAKFNNNKHDSNGWQKIKIKVKEYYNWIFISIDTQNSRSKSKYFPLLKFVQQYMFNKIQKVENQPVFQKY